MGSPGNKAPTSTFQRRHVSQSQLQISHRFKRNIQIARIISGYHVIRDKVSSGHVHIITVRGKTYVMIVYLK